MTKSDPTEAPENLHLISSMEAVKRSYKRWQQGEPYERTRQVMQHFFPAEGMRTGLNSRTRVQMVSLGDAAKRILACRREGEDLRTITLALNSNGIRGIMTLPVAMNNDAKVLVLAPPDLHEEAKAAGASIVGGADLVPDLIAGKLVFNRCIATPDMMPVLTKVARYLGPLGLMPTLKNGTLTKNLSHAIKAALNNVPFRIERKAGLMHMRVGMISSFNSSQLEQNVKAVYDNIAPFAKGVKGGKLVESAHLCLSSEPSIRLEPPKF